MSDTDDRTTLDALLQAVAAIPAKVDWHVAPIRAAGLILLADDRDEATLPMLEAIASQHGEVVAVSSVDGTSSGRELAGCLVRPAETDLKKAADSLRLSYALAIDAGSDEPPEL